MLVVYPSATHPIFIEWQKWRRKQEANWTHEGSDAMTSIERIARHLYPNSEVVGHMVIMDDLEQIEKEQEPERTGDE